MTQRIDLPILTEV